MKELSKYQAAIEKEYCTTNNNIIIEAGPGSGKSFTILHLLNKTPKFKKSILVAFNKSIADELKSKVPEHVKVSTLHALGFSVLRQNTFHRYKVNEIKSFILGRKYLNLDHLKPKQRDRYIFTISDIVDLARINLVSSKEEIENVCDYYGITTTNGEVDDAVKLMVEIEKYNKQNHREFMIDFTDMLYLANKFVKSEAFPKYNVVFCDELQDLNPLQRKLVENLMSENSRFVGVGDKRQSIYAFMGANLESFNSFCEKPNTTVMPLSVTYRCRERIVEEANKVFDGLEFFESNVGGIVKTGTLQEVQIGDFVICRNNLPLVEAWIEIIKHGKKASILGRDFGANILSIINKLSTFDSFDTGCRILLERKEEQLKLKGINNPKSTRQYNELVEKISIIELLVKNFGSYDIVEQKMNQIFGDKTSLDGVTLMTGHKSKGLEADRVFFLQPDLIPSKYASTVNDLYQEQCLKYVITTRARMELIYVY